MHLDWIRLMRLPGAGVPHNSPWFPAQAHVERASFGRFHRPPLQYTYRSEIPLVGVKVCAVGNCASDGRT